MKLFGLGALLFVIFSVGVLGQSRLDLKNAPVDDDFLAVLLNLSEMKELKPKNPTERNFFLRLYSLDQLSNATVSSEDDPSENCAPSVETEVGCGLRYFLAVHNGDLGVAGAVYDLGFVGEITKIEYLKRSNYDKDRLRLEVVNYPVRVFKLNRKLVKRTKVFELTVNMESLQIVESK